MIRPERACHVADFNQFLVMSDATICAPEKLVQLSVNLQDGVIEPFLTWWHMRVVVLERPNSEVELAGFATEFALCATRCFQHFVRQLNLNAPWDMLFLVANSRVGAQFCDTIDVLSILAPKLRASTAWANGWYMYCTLLHCADTRDGFQMRSVELGLHTGLLQGLTVPLSAPPYIFLALKSVVYSHWFAGGHCGARHMIPHVAALIAAYKHAERADERRSLALIFANMPTYFDDFSLDETDSLVLLKLRESGFLAVLQPLAMTFNVGEGSTGALMGTINAQADLFQRGCATAVPVRAYAALVKCLATALRGQAEQNIIWSPWHPSQALAHCACDGRSVTLLVAQGAVPLLVQLLVAGTGLGLWTPLSTETMLNSLYACLALARVRWHQPFLLLPPTVPAAVQDVLRHTRAAAALAGSASPVSARLIARCSAAALCLGEQTGAPVLQSLAVVCRRVLRAEFVHSHPPDSDGGAWAAWANRQHVPASMQAFLGAIP